MKNALNYFYGFYLDEVQKIYDCYYFSYDQDTYMVMPYDRSIEEAPILYQLNIEMLEQQFPMHRIILTKDRSVLFYHEEQPWVVLKQPKIKNRYITYQDLLNFSPWIISYDTKKKMDKSNWGIIWEKKIDYFEHQLKEIREKYPILSSSFFYYIGLFENAITYYYETNSHPSKKTICHRRVTVDMDLLSFYNPLTLVIDDKMRDVGEYLKSFVLKENYTKEKLAILLNMVIFQKEDVLLLISRILFPSYYFDLYEEIVIDEVPEKEIYKILEKQENILYLLSYLFQKYSFYHIPQIDWIKKEGAYSPS